MEVEDNTIITEYTKNKNGKKDGFLCAFNVNNKIKIGWAFCNLKYDKFDRESAEILSFKKALYLSKAKNFNNILSKVPYEKRYKYLRFLKRCQRYYKNAEFPEWFYTATGSF